MDFIEALFEVIGIKAQFTELSISIDPNTGDGKAKFTPADLMAEEVNPGDPVEVEFKGADILVALLNGDQENVDAEESSSG